MFTFPSNREYSSRTSCSRLETRGFESRRRGFSVSMGEEGSSIDDIFIYFIFLTRILAVLDAVVG